MYKTIIVEDEFDVRRAIISIVDWQGKGFSVEGEASNGQEALELIQTIEPDLVITDIKMPFMDGIQLATAIREINPVIKIVFLSGFNEFDYAISAMKLNVIDYILKPVSCEEFSNMLDKIRERLDCEKLQIRDIYLLQERFNNDWAILRNSFLISLIKSAPSEKQIDDKCKKFKLSLQGNCFVLFSMRIDHKSLSDSLIETDDVELLLLSSIDVAHKIGTKYLGVEAFIYEENVVVIISGEQSSIEIYSDILIREVHQHIHKYCGFSVTIGVSRSFQSLQYAPKAYSDSVSAIHYRRIDGYNRIIYINDYEKTNAGDYILSEANSVAFNSLIKTGDNLSLSDLLSTLFNELYETNASLESYQVCIMELFSLLLKASRNVNTEADINIGYHLNYLSDLYKQDTVDDIKVWFEKLCYQVMDSINSHRKNSSEIVAEQAKAYIESNYANSDLTLKSLSMTLHISPNYLSSVIKKSLNTSFTNILTKSRMEKAHELLLTTNKNLQDIAEETGYTDRHYFSYCFKRYYSFSPVQLRSQNKRNLST